MGSRRTSGERCVVPSAACYEDALPEAVEGGEAVGPSLDHLDLVDHSLGVAVADRLLEVGEQFFAPEPDAVGEGAERWQCCSVDGGEEALEPRLGLDELTERAPLLEAEPLPGLEQPVAGAEELLPPACLARRAPLLPAAKRRLALTLTANRVERLVRA